MLRSFLYRYLQMEPLTLGGATRRGRGTHSGREHPQWEGPSIVGGATHSRRGGGIHSGRGHPHQPTIKDPQTHSDGGNSSAEVLSRCVRLTTKNSQQSKDGLSIPCAIDLLPHPYLPFPSLLPSSLPNPFRLKHAFLRFSLPALGKYH